MAAHIETFMAMAEHGRISSGPRIIQAAGLLACLRTCNNEQLRSLPLRPVKQGNTFHFGYSWESYGNPRANDDTTDLFRRWGKYRNFTNHGNDRDFTLLRLFLDPPGERLNCSAAGLYVAQ